MPDVVQIFKRWYRAVALALLSLLVILVLINVAAILGIAFIDTVWPRSNVVEEKHGVDLSEVYPGWSRQDIDQLVRETWGRTAKFEPYVMFRERATRGRFVNVHEAGFRHSTDQGPWPPSESSYNVFLFGGSTTFSYGLPDPQTLASYLQNQMGVREGRPVKFYNFGTGAFQSTQEKLLFQELLVRGFKPDLALFVDGVNEFAFPHEPNGTRVLRLMLDDTPTRRLLLQASMVLARTPIARFAEGIGARVRRPDSITQGVVSATPEDPYPQELVDSVVFRYLANKRHIEAVARDAGIAVGFVWQPGPHYKYDQAYHPFRNEANKNLAVGYHRFRETLSQSATGNLVWCADMQDASKERLYVDAVHYTAAMSERFARAIAAALGGDHAGNGCVPAADLPREPGSR